jgi:superfamily II DNA or RNA helicase
MQKFLNNTSNIDKNITNKSILNPYLGQKGYTLLKKELTIEQQKQIRNDLTIKPYVGGTICNANPVTYPAYRESDKKFYVPHHYGVETFGPLKEYKLPEGDNIDLEFNGVLRDYQEPVVNKFIDVVTKPHDNGQVCGGGLLELPCAWGKTSGSLYILSQLKKKTLVIVHKEFLLNQWVERIQQFLPKARVGRIQGQIIDIEDKDIVIGMLQSLSMKEYPASVFESFGFTIIDEVHHISSQTFSNALFKIVTKYMLGLSATMNRKDGTTRVFKMFLGDVIFKGKRDEQHNAEVRAITYKVNDDEFNETILDYRGNPQNSSMISKLCEYNRRTEFIIKTICDFIKVDNVDDKTITNHKLLMDSQVPNCELCNKNNNYLVRNTCCNCVKYCLNCIENIDLTSQVNSNEKTRKNEKPRKVRSKCPNCNKILKYEQNYIENSHVKPLEEKHTIIMAHNLNILHYMYKKFICKNLASVGFYIGGMIEDELKKSEKKQVILASFSMCSEGLDIPTLNSQFLITPKSDIVQIVGRIMRAKHKYSHPIIYDFVDSHDIFQRQWIKRKAYYKSQNYKIVGSNSIDYNDNFNTWKTIYEPKVDQKNKITCNVDKGKKQLSIRSNSSSDKSITVDSDESDDEDEEEKLKRKNGLTGKCFINIKK